jgi:hypothetical protein
VPKCFGRRPYLRELAALGIRTSAIRLPPIVHGAGDHGFAPQLIQIARQKKGSGYVGDGFNRWPPCTSATPLVSGWLWRRDLREEPITVSPKRASRSETLPR